MPRIVPVFIMNRGCRNRCIFCNEAITTGGQPPVASAADIDRAVETALSVRKGKDMLLQIAFYGGNFTGLPLAEQKALLQWAAPHVSSGRVFGIRISTRPDDVSPPILEALKEGHVRTVEIGAQSLVDRVLLAARRGHTAEQVARAVGILKAAGFEVGLHLMAGLPGDSEEGFAATVTAAVALRPDSVRIHPTLVLRDTPLANAYRQGLYRPLTLEAAVRICKDARRNFMEAGIPVIRMGLQTTPAMEVSGAVVAGPYHPAFGALVEAAILYEKATEALERLDARGCRVVFHLPRGQESAFRGQRNANVRLLTERFFLTGLRVVPADAFGCTIESSRS
jgi:histone acetyltransferase (RNA polymerase elongator complex component)